MFIIALLNRLVKNARLPMALLVVNDLLRTDLDNMTAGSLTFTCPKEKCNFQNFNFFSERVYGSAESFLAS